MASKQTELHVDDLLNSFETRKVPIKGAKDTKAAKPDTNDWDDQEEENFALGIGRTQQTSKAKPKKKTVAKGWGDIDAGSAPQQPTVEEFPSLGDDGKKKKIFNKPNGTTKAPANVDVDEEYFPSLGEERSREAPKKHQPVVQQHVSQPQTSSSTSSGGVKKFVNAKKQGAGETFVPLAPVQEKVVPVVIPEKTEPVVVQPRAPGTGFQRRTVEEQQPKETPVDTKFKFGGEGPKRFVTASKISFKREEEKSELELAREEKEREVEERLAKEREELAKQRDVKKSFRPEEKNDSPKEKTEQASEEKRIARFSNTKKEAEKVKVEPVVEKKIEVEEVIAETKPTLPVENVEMNGTLTNKGWGEGPLVKKTQKK